MLFDKVLLPVNTKYWGEKCTDLHNNTKQFIKYWSQQVFFAPLITQLTVFGHNYCFKATNETVLFLSDVALIFKTFQTSCYFVNKLKSSFNFTDVSKQTNYFVVVDYCHVFITGSKAIKHRYDALIKHSTKPN